MSFGTAVLSKRFPTFITSVWFDSTMYEVMSFQIALLSKHFPTFVTSVLSDSTMYDEKTFQATVFSIYLPTVVARVARHIASALPTVNYHVAPFRRRLSIAVTFVMVLWTSADMFFLALWPGMVVGAALFQLHETWKRVDDQSFSWDRQNQAAVTDTDQDLVKM